MECHGRRIVITPDGADVDDWVRIAPVLTLAELRIMHAEYGSEPLDASTAIALLGAKAILGARVVKNVDPKREGQYKPKPRRTR